MHISTIYQAFIECNGVSTDTRSIKNGNLFFALKGPNFNGNKYALKALELGAHFVIVDEPLASEKAILVDNVLTTLQELAKYHRNKLTIPIICITGSNGKTTTKELTHAVLSTKYKVFATKGNFNNHIGVPLSILSIEAEHEMAIIELGANHVGEIGELCEIAQPNYALITNIGTAHIEGFGSQENIFKAKTELFGFVKKSDNGEAVFVNIAHANLLEAAQEIRTISFGKGATFLGGNVNEGSLFCELLISTEEDGVDIISQLIGNYNAANIMAAAAIGRFFNIGLLQTKEAIEAYKPSNNRSQWVKKDGNSFILDAYNANPSSMKAAINNLHSIDHPTDKKRLILGHMLELGETSFQAHSDLINSCVIYNPILVGSEFQFFKDEFQWFENVADLKTWFEAQNFKDYLFLVKGSRGARLEKLLE